MDKQQLTFVKNALRRASHRWGPIWKTKNKARRKYVGPRKKQKYEYRCNCCELYFPSGDVQVDHIIPVGPLNKNEDIIGYVERLLCSEAGLQVLCTSCHQKKTDKDMTKP